MRDVQSIILELTDACKNPRARMDAYLAQGKKVVGCFPPYTPEELIHASGMIPFGCWGAQTELKLAKQYLPAFACSILQTNLELGLKGAYKGMTAMVIPTLCDTLRCLTQDWRFGVEDIPMVPITYPQNRKIAAATDFLVSEFETVLAKLSVITGQMLNDEKLEETMAIYNAHSEAMMTFAAVANDHLDVITPDVRHYVMKSAYFYEKQEHTAIIKELIEALSAQPVHKFKGKKVVLSGIIAEPIEVFEIMKENKIAVVADDLAHESRQYRTLIPEKGTTPLRRLAGQWMNRKGCSLIHEDFKSRGEMLAQMCEAAKADGLIYCLMKFCDPEEYDYPIVRNTLLEADYPVLLIEIDQLTTSCEQIRTRIQTFGEMI